MCKVVVTGGAGFIGSHTCRALLNRGDEVICIDNFNDYYSPENKENNISDLLENSNFTLHKADICDQSKLEEIFKQSAPEKIIHLAARAGVRPSIEDPALYSKVNIDGTVNLLDLAAKFKVANFIFASSSSVYGNRDEVPFNEEMDVSRPISPYAATKRAGELLCSTYNHLYKIPITCLRFFTVYGPCGRPDMAPLLFTDAIFNGRPIRKFGDGTSRRDYTYIDDIVAGILAATDANLNFEIINLGNSDTISLNDFIETIESVVGKKAEIIQEGNKPGDVNKTYADISKAKSLLGFKPETPVSEGLKKMFAWYKERSTH